MKISAQQVEKDLRVSYRCYTEAALTYCELGKFKKKCLVSVFDAVDGSILLEYFHFVFQHKGCTVTSVTHFLLTRVM